MTETLPVQSESSAPDASDPLARITAAKSDEDKVRLTAELILQAFDAYYVESRSLPALAKAAFERRDPAATIALSKRRLSIYSVSVAKLGAELKAAFPELGRQESLWREIERLYLPLIGARYEADLAFAYIHSIRRKACTASGLPAYSMCSRAWP